MPLLQFVFRLWRFWYGNRNHFMGTLLKHTFETNFIFSSIFYNKVHHMLPDIVIWNKNGKR